MGLDPHHARRLRGTEAHREDRPERDRDLPEHVPWLTLAEHALDPVDEPGGLDATLEDREQRALGALVRGVLARREADVGRHPRQLLTLGRVERCEQRHATYLVRSDHGCRDQRYPV